MGITVEESKAQTEPVVLETPSEKSSDEKILSENKADHATQQARIRALGSKRMLLVSGSGVYPSMGEMLKNVALELMSSGLEVYMVFQEGLQNDKYYSYALEHKAFTKALFADMKGPKAAENVANAAIAASCGESSFFDGAWTPHEATQMLNAKVAKKLGLPGHDPRCYEIAQDKYLTRKALADAGLNTARAVQLFSEEDCDMAAKVVGFPMIVKPCTGMGSLGVYKVSDESQLRKVVAKVLDEVSQNWALSCKAHEGQAPVLAETFIDPLVFGKDGLVTEFDCDLLMWNGELMYGNVIDNWKPTPPYFQDRGFHAPSQTPVTVQEELIAYCAACVKAMGFKQGNFHMEAWMTPTGPILIECNPRVGGGSIDKTHRMIWGVSPIINFAMASLGIPINPPRNSMPSCSYGFMLVNASKTGILTDSSFFNVIDKETEAIKQVTAFKSNGDSVKGLDTGVPEWLCQVDVSLDADRTQEMVEVMEKVMDKVILMACENTVPTEDK